jgi:hypothetical protein
MTYLIPLVSTAALELLVLRRLRFGWFVIATALAGLLVDGSYLSYTSIFERSYDGPSHVLYIDEIAERLRLPTVNLFCTPCGHPPLYYALAALWSKTVLATGLVPRELGLQWLSLLLFSGFVIFALLLLRSLIEQPATLRLAAALVVLWPSSVPISVRVHNDALAVMLIVAAMYFVTQWDRQGRRRDFCLAVVASALALLTKATGYAMAATLLLVAALRWRSTRFGRDSLAQLVAATLVLLCAALLAASFRQAPAPRTLCQKVLGSACDVPSDVFVGNRPINYLAFDLPGFLRSTNPTAPFRDDYFLNGLAKSSLLGAMPLGKDFAGRFYRQLALGMGLLLLAMAALCVATLPSFVRSADWRRYRALVIAASALLALLLALRMLVPTTLHEDFRHIFSALVPLCLVYAKVVERLKPRSLFLYRTGVAMALLMIALSATFFVRFP